MPPMAPPAWPASSPSTARKKQRVQQGEVTFRSPQALKHDGVTRSTEVKKDSLWHVLFTIFWTEDTFQAQFVPVCRGQYPCASVEYHQPGFEAGSFALSFVCQQTHSGADLLHQLWGT